MSLQTNSVHRLKCQPNSGWKWHNRVSCALIQFTLYGQFKFQSISNSFHGARIRRASFIAIPAEFCHYRHFQNVRRIKPLSIFNYRRFILRNPIHMKTSYRFISNYYQKKMQSLHMWPISVDRLWRRMQMGIQSKMIAVAPIHLPFISHLIIINCRVDRICVHSVAQFTARTYKHIRVGHTLLSLFQCFTHEMSKYCRQASFNHT